MEQHAERMGDWVENRSTHGARALHLRQLWAYRELIGFLAIRDLKVRYKQALFGIGWTVLQPLAGAVAFTLLFRQLADVPSDGIPYPAFAFCGFAVWSYVSSSVTTARASLITNVPLITKVYFPRLCLPLASVLPSLVDLAGALVFLAAMMAWYRIRPGIAVLAAPVFLLEAVVVAFGTSTFFATLSVQYRDVQQVFALLVQLWLFASPVAYPSSLVHGAWRWVYALNPMAGVLEGTRWALLNGPPPGKTALASAASAGLILVVGLLAFQRAERRFADVI